MKKLIIATGLLMTTSAYAQTEVLTGGYPRKRLWSGLQPSQNPNRT